LYTTATYHIAAAAVPAGTAAIAAAAVRLTLICSLEEEWRSSEQRMIKEGKAEKEVGPFRKEKASFTHT